MDSRIDNVFIRHNGEIRALDHATWLNFTVRSLECFPFKVIESESGEFAVISDDVAEFLDEGFQHTIPKDYVDFGIEHAGWIAMDSDKLEHWQHIYDAFANIPTEVLIFILEMKLPLKWIIRQELIFRKKDRLNQPCTSEDA